MEERMDTNPLQLPHHPLHQLIIIHPLLSLSIHPGATHLLLNHNTNLHIINTTMPHLLQNATTTRLRHPTSLTLHRLTYPHNILNTRHRRLKISSLLLRRQLSTPTSIIRSTLL